MTDSDQENYAENQGSAAAEGTEPNRLVSAPKAMLAAFGGNIPDWLRDEADALSAAIAAAGAAPNPDDPTAKIAIFMEGGFLLDVISAGVPVSYVIVNFDADGDDPQAVMIPQATPALLSIGEAMVRAATDPEVLTVFELAESRG